MLSCLHTEIGLVAMGSVVKCVVQVGSEPTPEFSTSLLLYAKQLQSVLITSEMLRQEFVGKLCVWLCIWFRNAQRTNVAWDVPHMLALFCT